MLNNNGPRYKRSKLERQMNVDVFWCVIILLVMCLFTAIGESRGAHQPPGALCRCCDCGALVDCSGVVMEKPTPPL